MHAEKAKWLQWRSPTVVSNGDIQQTTHSFLQHNYNYNNKDDDDNNIQQQQQWGNQE